MNGSVEGKNKVQTKDLDYALIAILDKILYAQTLMHTKFREMHEQRAIEVLRAALRACEEYEKYPQPLTCDYILTKKRVQIWLRLLVDKHMSLDEIRKQLPK